MDRVYAESFLNISATAGTDSSQGFPLTRALETEVIVNIKDVPFDELAIAGDAQKSPTAGLLGNTNLRRCRVIDSTFWDRCVENGPVNRRGWVLQERMMARRVLHFCDGQMAWECCEFKATEEQPLGIKCQHTPRTSFNEQGYDTYTHHKSLIPEIDGKRLRDSELKGKPDPVPQLQPQMFALELWRRITEMYSKTTLTNPDDKLIALSGLAKLMAPKIGSPAQPAQYIAGMRWPNIERQLLWVVNTQETGAIPHSKAPETYRAPTFSWASLDTYNCGGITAGKIPDEETYFEVVKLHIDLEFSSDNEYGLINGGYLIVTGLLYRISMY